MDWIVAIGEKVVNTLGELEERSQYDEDSISDSAYLAELRGHDSTPVPEDKLLDLADAQKSILLEQGVNFVINKDGTQVQIFVSVHTGFKFFLDFLDTKKAALRRKPKGPAHWTLFNVRNDPVLFDELCELYAVDYRERWKAPTSPVDILLIGAYMKEDQILREQQILQSRGERYIPRSNSASLYDEQCESKDESSTPTYLREMNGHPSSKVRIMRRFSSHEEVKEQVRTIYRDDIVVATPEEWQIYQLVKLILGSELTFMALLKKWCSLARKEEFEAYDARKPFNYLQSLRRFLDSRAFFGGVRLKANKNTLDDPPEDHPPLPITTKFEGLRETAELLDSPDSAYRTSSLVNVALTLTNEYEQRKEILVLIEVKKERLFACLDEILGEYRRRGSDEYIASPGKFSVPCATMDNMISIRDEIESLAPEMFCGSV